MQKRDPDEIMDGEEPSAKRSRIDDSNEEDGFKGSIKKNSSKEKEAEEKAQSFPVLMMRIIKEDTSGATMWNKAGDTFCVLEKQFKDNLLEKYFSGTKFESFTRKLNRWGFRRVIDQHKEFPRGALVYNHKLFQRDKPDLLVNMTATRQRNDRATLEQLVVEEQLASLARQQQQQLAAAVGFPSAISHVGSGAPLSSVLGNSTHASLLGGVSQAALQGARLSDLLSIQQQLQQQQQQQGLSPSFHATAAAAQPLGTVNNSRLLDTLLLQQQRQASLSAGALSLNPVVPPDPSLLALQRTAASTGLGLPSSSPLFGNMTPGTASLLSPSTQSNNSNLIDQVARRQEERQREILLLQLQLQQQQQQEQQQQQDALRNILFRGSFR